MNKILSLLFLTVVLSLSITAQEADSTGWVSGHWVQVENQYFWVAGYQQQQQVVVVHQQPQPTTVVYIQPAPVQTVYIQPAYSNFAPPVYYNSSYYYSGNNCYNGNRCYNSGFTVFGHFSFRR